MAGGFKSIKDAIVTTLNTLVPSTLYVVYGKKEKKFSGYPAVCVSANNFQGAFQTVASQNGTNKETYQHFIHVYFRTDEQNDPDYEDVLTQVADTVITTLRQNIKLNGAVDWCIPSSGSWRFGEKESPTRVFELILTSTVFNSR